MKAINERTPREKVEDELAELLKKHEEPWVPKGKRDPQKELDRLRNGLAPMGYW